MVTLIQQEDENLRDRPSESVVLLRKIDLTRAIAFDSIIDPVTKRYDICGIPRF